MRKHKEIRDYYSWWEIYIAFIKKLLGIKSPSAIYISDGKYEYKITYCLVGGFADGCFWGHT